jgi:pimeloyl-ACP methyl ester carboxylesterase
MFRIESLLSARLFLAPQVVGDRIYFISNLSGRLSLYAMDYGGSVPEPLLPPHIALQNPELIGGQSFFVFPALGKIVVMIDQDGNEVYQPMVIPLEGGYPVPAFSDRFDGFRVFMGGCDPESNLLYLAAASLKAPTNFTYLANLATGELTLLVESLYGMFPSGRNPDHTKVALVEGYTVGDGVLFLWEKGKDGLRTLYGTPMAERSPDFKPPLDSIGECYFVRAERGLLCFTTRFSDIGGLGYLDLDQPGELQPVEIQGLQHHGMGEFTRLVDLKDDLYLARYNIDGCDWVYEAAFDEKDLVLRLGRVIVGQGQVSNGVLEHIDYEKASGRFAFSYSTATSPTQIYTDDNGQLARHTRERLLGMPAGLLSPGEDASYTTFDGLRVSARLYLPAVELGYQGPRPLVYYIHGGPQGQERPDFAWFSMPLIQFLTLNGFAVFVPNVRGSTGYGLSYTKHVDRDWGGQDRLDHVHAMTEVLPKDSRVDVRRAGVAGRSYGGYMTLTLAFRHPELWSAAVDMFGPYDLLSFQDRIPETWKPYFYMALGHPEKDRDFLVERSPRTYMNQIACPMLVIQGKNDPRVVEAESRDVVEHLRDIGKQVEYLMFENEGHDVLKFENRVTCYNAITDFFKKTLKP